MPGVGLEQTISDQCVVAQIDPAIGVQNDDAVLYAALISGVNSGVAVGNHRAILHHATVSAKNAITDVLADGAVANCGIRGHVDSNAEISHGCAVYYRRTGVNKEPA